MATAETTASSARRLSRERTARLVSHWLAVAVLVFFAFVISIPFLWMVSTALKSFDELYVLPPQILPTPPRFDNLWNSMTVPGTPFTLYVYNTLYIAFFALIGAMLANTVVAFAFSRMRWKGRDFWFAVMLSTMFLPSQVTIIPVYILMHRLGWIDTWNPLIVPNFFGAPWIIFLVRQFMMTIPLEMDDAARIDGCNTWQLFWRIILPLAKPVVATVAIFTFQGVWNDYFGPLIYLNTRDKWTVGLALSQFNPQANAVGAGYRAQEQLLMGAALMVTLPLIIIFLTCQRLFIPGIVVSGVKG